MAVDVYHVWWDPDLASQILRAGNRILAFHVSDWLVPTTDLVNDRGRPGDGVINIPSIRRLVENAGFNGAIELKYSRRTGGRKILTARWILASIASRIIVKNDHE